jgi:hypothetical protein
VNYVYLHLAINHSPLFATLFGFFVLLIGVLKRNRSVVTAGLAFAILAAVCAGAAFFTGDQAADIVKSSPPIAGLDPSLIREHELAADFCLAASCITAVLAIVTLFVRRRWLEIVVLVFFAWSLSVVMRTALLGGRIHHPEVRAQAAAHAPKA